MSLFYLCFIIVFSFSHVCLGGLGFDSFTYLGMAHVKYTAKEIDHENPDHPTEEEQNLAEGEELTLILWN